MLPSGDTLTVPLTPGHPRLHSYQSPFSILVTRILSVLPKISVEDAAARLNDAYSAADQAQKLVGDTAAMLITDGALDSPYLRSSPGLSAPDRNPLHYPVSSGPDRMVF